MGPAVSSQPDLRLVPVDEGNRGAVLGLRVKMEQMTLVASTAKWLRQVEQNHRLVPRALMEGAEVVGFALYEIRPDGSAFIWRVLVDERHQGRGLGRRLMELLLEELRAQGARRFAVSHRPQNRVAAKLFESMGFEETWVDPDGEVTRELGG